MTASYPYAFRHGGYEMVISTDRKNDTRNGGLNDNPGAQEQHFPSPSLQTLKRKDLLILAHLRQDGRMPLTILSRKTGIPVSTIFDRIKITEQGIIKRHTSLLDFGKLGYADRVSLMLRAGKDKRSALGDFLGKHQSVNSCYRISQDFDFLVDAVFSQVPDVHAFIELIEQRFDVHDLGLFYIIYEIARERFLADPQMV